MPNIAWLDKDKTIKQTSRASYLLFELDLVQLNDGRILVVEYKGSQFAGSDDVEEKELIGKVFERNKWMEYIKINILRILELKNF